MVKKRKLVLEYAPDFKAFGLFAALKGYRLCWLLNKDLGLDLKRMPEFLYTPYKAVEAISFPVFFYKNPALLLQYFLLVNKTTQGVLVEQPKNMDFLFLVRNPVDHGHADEVVRYMKQIPNVQAVFPFDEKLAKRVINVFYDFEMFVGALKDE